MTGDTRRNPLQEFITATGLHTWHVGPGVAPTRNHHRRPPVCGGRPLSPGHPRRLPGKPPQVCWVSPRLSTRPGKKTSPRRVLGQDPPIPRSSKNASNDSTRAALCRERRNLQRVWMGLPRKGKDNFIWKDLLSPSGPPMGWRFFNSQRYGSHSSHCGGDGKTTPQRTQTLVSPWKPRWLLVCQNSRAHRNRGRPTSPDMCFIPPRERKESHGKPNNHQNTKAGHES